jgi:hypothetical protein
MKTILLLILSAFTAFAATTYPVLTDNANRTFSGGGTNLALLNATNQVFTGTNTFNTNLIFGSSTLQTQLDSKPTVALTNLSILNATNQVFTGTNTFSGPLAVTASITPAVVSARVLLGKNGTAPTMLLDSGLTYWSLDNASGDLRFVRSGSLLATMNSTGDWAISGNVSASGSANTVFNSSGGSFGIGTASPSGLQITTTTASAARGVDNVRLGLNVGVTPTIHLENNTAGVSWALDNASGVFRFVRNSATVPLSLDATTGALIIGASGTAITTILSATATLDYDLTALVVEDKTITVTGAVSGDTVSIGVPSGSVTATVQYTGWVSAADTVTIRARTSVVGENPASGTFRATVTRF